MYRPCNRAEFAITHCAILSKPHRISQQPMPIASRATAAVIKTATSCGSCLFSCLLQWPYQRDDEQDEGDGGHHTARQRQAREREDDRADQRRKP
jgi:hypothetical protein